MTSICAIFWFIIIKYNLKSPGPPGGGSGVKLSVDLLDPDGEDLPEDLPLAAGGEDVDSRVHSPALHRVGQDKIVPISILRKQLEEEKAALKDHGRRTTKLTQCQ